MNKQKEVSKQNGNKPDPQNIGLKELLDDHYLGHSIFQQDYFIITRANGPTIYGQYKQALRELYKRTKGLMADRHQREILTIDMDELKYKIDKAAHTTGIDQFELRRWKADLKFKGTQLEQEGRQTYELAREWLRFFQQAQYLKAEIGEITPQKRAELEEEMWYTRLLEQLSVDIQSTGMPKNTTLELIYSFPADLREVFFEDMKDPNLHKRIQDWHKEYTKLPPAEEFEFSEEEIQKVIEHGEGFFQLQGTNNP